MKQLSIEEKAKAYDEAIERARYWEKNPTVWSSDDICQKLFPELRGSDDERTRKAISQCVEDMRGQFEKLYSVHHKDAIDWLENKVKNNKRL